MERCVGDHLRVFPVYRKLKFSIVPCNLLFSTGQEVAQLFAILKTFSLVALADTGACCSKPLKPLLLIHLLSLCNFGIVTPKKCTGPFVITNSKFTILTQFLAQRGYFNWYSVFYCYHVAGTAPAPANTAAASDIRTISSP